MRQTKKWRELIKIKRSCNVSWLIVKSKRKFDTGHLLAGYRVCPSLSNIIFMRWAPSNGQEIFHHCHFVGDDVTRIQAFDTPVCCRVQMFRFDTCNEIFAASFATWVIFSSKSAFPWTFSDCWTSWQVTFSQVCPCQRPSEKSVLCVFNQFVSLFCRGIEPRWEASPAPPSPPPPPSPGSALRATSASGARVPRPRGGQHQHPVLGGAAETGWLARAWVSSTAAETSPRPPGSSRAGPPPPSPPTPQVQGPRHVPAASPALHPARPRLLPAAASLLLPGGRDCWPRGWADPSTPNGTTQGSTLLPPLSVCWSQKRASRFSSRWVTSCILLAFVWAACRLQTMLSALYCL